MPALNRCIPAIRKSDTLEAECRKLRVPTLGDFERVASPLPCAVLPKEPDERCPYCNSAPGEPCWLEKGARRS